MNRRQTLIAAAKVAPLIATLPCGALAANASTYQCIANDKDLTDRGGVSLVSPTADNFVRVIGFQRDCITGPYYNVLGQWYLRDSTPVDAPPEGPVEVTADDKQIGIAVAFTPDKDLTGIINVSLRFDGFAPGTTALHGSCWASMSPQAGLEGLTP